MQVSNKGLENTSEKAINIPQLWMRYFSRYRYLFIVLFLVMMAGAWVYMNITLPVYEISARLLIKDEKKGVADAMNDERGSIAILNTSKISENEMEILQSRSIIGEVVKTLHLYAPVFQKGKLVSASAYTTSPIVIEAAEPDSLQQVKKVYFTYNASSNKVIINGQYYALDTFTKTPYGRLKFVLNPNKDEDKTPAEDPFYFNLVSIKNVAADIRLRLTVGTASKVSSILNLTLDDEVPERGVDVLNQLLTAYNKASLNDKNGLAANTLAFVEDRLAHVRHDLDSIEAKMQQYKTSKGAVNVSEQGHLFLQNVSANDQKIGDMNMQLAALSKVESYVQSKQLQGGIVPSSMGISDPLLNDLLNRLSSAQLQYERIRKTTPENNPLSVSIDDQIAKLRPEILENIRSHRIGIEAGKQNLLSTNASYSAVLGTLPQKERELVDISREQNIRSEIYLLLLKKREESALTFSSNVSDNRIVDRAEASDVPVSPKKVFVYAAAFILALLSGLAIAAVKEGIGGKIVFRRDIEEITGQPVLGELVVVKKGSKIVTDEANDTLIAEQFRKLWVSLTYPSKPKTAKRLMITSSVSGEGKTFIAANLALSLANAGKKVMIIDVDLRNPSVAAMYDLPEESLGLTDILKGGQSMQQVVQSGVLHSNLDIIPAGSFTDKPTKLFNDGKFELLLEYLDHSYDYVILDTPPAGIVSDAYLLSDYCHACLYVVKQNYTPKAALVRMEHNNQLSRLCNTGIVFNSVTAKEFNQYQHHYYKKTRRSRSKKTAFRNV